MRGSQPLGAPQLADPGQESGRGPHHHAGRDHRHHGYHRPVAAQRVQPRYVTAHHGGRADFTHWNFSHFRTAITFFALLRYHFSNIVCVTCQNGTTGGISFRSDFPVSVAIPMVLTKGTCGDQTETVWNGRSVIGHRWSRLAEISKYADCFTDNGGGPSLSVWVCNYMWVCFFVGESPLPSPYKVEVTEKGPTVLSDSRGSPVPSCE